MTGSFNEKGNSDFTLIITEEELTALVYGKVVRGEIEYYWKNERNTHTLDVAIMDEVYFREMRQSSAEQFGVDSWQTFALKLGIARKGNHHSVYISDELYFTENIAGKTFEQRYCDQFSVKSLLQSKTYEL